MHRLRLFKLFLATGWLGGSAWVRACDGRAITWSIGPIDTNPQSWAKPSGPRRSRMAQGWNAFFDACWATIARGPLATQRERAAVVVQPAVTGCVGAGGDAVAAGQRFA